MARFSLITLIISFVVRTVTDQYGHHYSTPLLDLPSPHKSVTANVRADQKSYNFSYPPEKDSPDTDHTE